MRSSWVVRHNVQGQNRQKTIKIRVKASFLEYLPSQQKIFIRHSVNLVLRFYDDIIENMFIQLHEMTSEKLKCPTTYPSFVGQNVQQVTKSFREACWLNLWMNGNFFNIRSCDQLTTFVGECRIRRELPDSSSSSSINGKVSIFFLSEVFFFF